MCREPANVVNKGVTPDCANSQTKIARGCRPVLKLHRTTITKHIMANLQFPESILPTLAAGFFLVVLYFIYTNRRASNIPPGPWSWPIVGALPSYMIGKMRGFDLMHEFLQELAKRYGDVCSIKLGKSLMVVLSEKDIARDVFQGNDFADRPKSIVTNTQPTGKKWGRGGRWCRYSSCVLRILSATIECPLLQT